VAMLKILVYKELIAERREQARREDED